MGGIQISGIRSYAVNRRITQPGKWKKLNNPSFANNAIAGRIRFLMRDAMGRTTMAYALHRTFRRNSRKN